MIQLQTITNIFLIVFCGFYIVGTFWKPLIIRKKTILKKTWAKNKIDLISMEMQQAILKIEREQAVAERNTIYKQIEDLDNLRKDQEKEREELKKNNGADWEEKIKLKTKEILENEEQGKKLVKELQDADRAIKLAELKIGQYQEQMSMVERSLKLSKDIIKMIC